MKNIKTYASFVLDGRDIIILGDSYKGLPLIAYEPDILVVPKLVFKKYSKEAFIFMNKPNYKTKIIKIV